MSNKSDPKIGDPITRVTAVRINGRFETVFDHCYVSYVDEEYFGAGAVGLLRISREGLVWARGHISLDSDEGKALRVAYTLRFLLTEAI